MAYPYLPGSHTAAFQGVSVLAGLMVSIGASSIVAQGASGLILIYTKSLRKGEFVRIGQSEGTVAEVGMFATRLRTGFGEEIALPNAFILGNTVRNFSRARPGTGYMLDTGVTIGYDTPWRQVHAMLAAAAAATPGIAADPAPIVAQTALSDFYIEYKLIAYVEYASPRDRAEVLTHLHQNIVDEFNLRGGADHVAALHRAAGGGARARPSGLAPGPGRAAARPRPMTGKRVVAWMPQIAAFPRHQVERSRYTEPP